MFVIMLSRYSVFFLLTMRQRTRENRLRGIIDSLMRSYKNSRLKTFAFELLSRITQRPCLLLADENKELFFCFFQMCFDTEKIQDI